ncbi:hypothetical protein NX059_002959 [Plenodomus lindquistii]|nr:hypothetical protein NX059_002959 [Plenodomus lindquistii]
MPIFHDPHDSSPQWQTSGQVPAAGFPRTQAQPGYALNEQMTQSWPTEAAPVSAVPTEQLVSEAPIGAPLPTTLDRVELIDRLKRTKSPTWLQRCSEERYFDRSSRPSSRDRPQTPRPNVGELETSHASTPEPLRDLAAAGLAIERPRSALHSGDFRAQKDDDASGKGPSPKGFLATSPVAPWHRSFPAAANPVARKEASFAFNDAPTNEACAVSRARAISQSTINAFAFLPPTSPLVQQANNTDLDSASRPGSRQSSRSPERNNRRHTFSPASFQGYRPTEMARSASGTPAARHLRHTSSIPCQAHQPRRTPTYNQSQPQSNPATPFLGSRRPSFSSEASPLQHAPMVGSYEESILRGRMSTTPSRPLDFVAKIGVLGKGQCKSSLKCPPHVTIPFPAVFYSYNTGNGRISDNEPSPYVGLIDLEHSLPQPTENTDPSKRTRRHAASDLVNEDLDFRLQFGDEPAGQASKQDVRRKEKRKRRSTSPKAPAGGSYRIPPQGQLQIVLKNPNKTAVKLFLVPYDFSDMEAGQKTFIRQRSYSAGPIIDMPSSSRRNLGTDRPEAALSNSDDPNDRPILRYLIHLHICCPSKGRFYLYKSIRVVFANRVPDGKEKLRNEIQLPEPKYSVYKPTRDVTTVQTLSSLGSQLIAEKAFRRRSAGWSLSHSQQSFDRMDGLQQNPPLPPPALQFCPLSASASSKLVSAMPDLQPIPFSLSRLAAIESRPVSRDQMDIDPQSPFKTPVQSPKSPFDQADGTFEKLNKGDVGYGGNAFSPVSSPTTPLSAGLLSQRLRGLDVQREYDRRGS